MKLPRTKWEETAAKFITSRGFVLQVRKGVSESTVKNFAKRYVCLVEQ